MNFSKYINTIFQMRSSPCLLKYTSMLFCSFVCFHVKADEVVVRKSALSSQSIPASSYDRSTAFFKSATKTGSSVKASNPSESQRQRVQAIDAHVLATPARVESNPDTLLAYLLEPAQNDFEKVRAIYRWVTSRITYSTSSPRLSSDANERLLSLLKKRRGSCDVYAVVFADLATRAGLNVKTIHGVAKGGIDGFASRPGKPNHVWNAVNLDGKWLAIDPTWAAGSVGDKGYEAKLNDDYFLKSPDEIMASHFDLQDTFGIQARNGLTEQRFRGLPETAADAVAVGFNLNQVLGVSQQGTPKQLVDTFAQPTGTFKVVEMPLLKVIQKKPQVFKIDTAAYEKLVVVQGNSWVDFEKQGSTFWTKATPRKGELLVMGLRNGESEYEALLGYEVR